MAEKPLTLRDFLELDCESSSDGFRCYPRRLGDAAPVRHLLDAELRFGRSPTRTGRSAKSAALAKISYLSRSLSKRLRGSFWTRREEEQLDEAASCGLPSPVVSSCSESESETETDSDVTSESNSASDFVHSSAASSECLADIAAAATAAAGDEQKALKSEPMERNLEMDDKEQLSPVSIMDFPFEDDDEDEEEEEGAAAASARSPSLHESLAHLERTKMQLLHKIRRFESLAELGPVDLEARFAASESEDYDDHHLECSSNERQNLDEDNEEEEQEQNEECRLLGLLNDTVSVGTNDMIISEKLLLDFFAEELSSPCRKRKETVEEAKEWVEGRGSQWDLRDVLCGEAAVAEMERSRRWMCVDEEEREVGAAVEGLVLDDLVDALVKDLVRVGFGC